MIMYTNVAQKGNYLCVRGVENGKRFSTKVEFSPTIWVPGQLSNCNDKWTTLDGQEVYSLQPGSINDCRKFIENHKDVHGFPIYESPGHVYQYITENYSGEINFDPQDISVYTIDIETEVEGNSFPDPAFVPERVLLITIKDTRHNNIITWGLRPFDEVIENVEYRYFPDEQELLKDFIVWWQQNYPDVVTGWNSSLFDITYLYNRMVNILGETLAKKLSPWGSVRQREMTLGGRTSIKTYILGVASLDYLDLYKKFGTYSAMESYKLDYIAQVELGERKLEIPGSTFKEKYDNHWNMFVRYNVKDVELVDKLDDKMKLMDLALSMAYTAKVNYEDVFGPVKVWDVIIYNYLNERKIVIPKRKEDAKKDEPFEGAYVKEPLVGKHNWCVSFDLNSLYPHLIMQYNMSPETITNKKFDVCVDDLLEQQYDLGMLSDLDYTIAANGWCFKKDRRGILPIQMEIYYNLRSVYKKQMLQAKQKLQDTGDPKWAKEVSKFNNLQMAVKILLNSCFGACGNVSFRYYDRRIAEGITISGQLSIRWIANKLNQFLNKMLPETDRVVLIDTDSVVLTLEDLINKVCPNKTTDQKIKYLDKVSEEILQPFIDKCYQELADYMNAYEQKMQMKRENLVDVMISVSKKRYMMSVYNSEGVQYKEPQLKIMGLHMVKSSTPAVIRDKLKESVNVILRGTESQVQKYVSDYLLEFTKLPPESIAFPRSINDIKKYESKSTIYTKATPIHVRGALLYNHFLKKHNLTKKYQLIREGDKIKFLYLKTPNPIHEDCIAFLDKLPPEFDLTSYVDYSKMFEKTFEDAVENIIEPLGWSTKPKATLEDWFS